MKAFQPSICLFNLSYKPPNELQLLKVTICLTHKRIYTGRVINCCGYHSSTGSYFDSSIYISITQSKSSCRLG